jgi:hypothetical protein
VHRRYTSHQYRSYERVGEDWWALCVLCSENVWIFCLHNTRCLGTLAIVDARWSVLGTVLGRHYSNPTNTYATIVVLTFYS